MIKYATIDGYKNFGEISMFSHLYQFMQENKETPMTILIHAYECKPKVFKGYIFNKDKTYRSIPLENSEKKTIDNYVGDSEQVEFNEFIKGTIAEEYYSCFTTNNSKELVDR